MSPTNARRSLRIMWDKVAVYSCADGTFRIEPKWRKSFNRPGMLTRMHTAVLIGDVLNLPVKKINWKARVK